MIGKLRGLLDSIGEDFLILDVQGVGYTVHCSARTLNALPRPGEALALSIETQMREDSLRLFGFPSEAEREWFRLLQSVQGVGAKVALAIQSALDTSELALAIACADKAALARAPGVGPKLAARIIAELKDKAASPEALGPAVQGPVAAGGETVAARDAILALVNLGYGRTQAAAAVAASFAGAGEKAAASDLIRSALKELTR